MIKINLCPDEELESPYFWVPDAAFAVVVGALALFGVWHHLDSIQDNIDATTERIASLQASTSQLEPDIKRFDRLDEDIKSLNQKIAALQSITVSKTSKYKPVIVVEHLQNLRPEGVWYEFMKFGIDGIEDRFELRGQAFDNILTAELMTAMRATGSQEADASDLRTQVYFKSLTLAETAVPKSPPEGFPELGPYPIFTIKGEVGEREVATSDTAAETLALRDTGDKADGAAHVRF